MQRRISFGIGGARTLDPGQGSTYSVTLQSLTNVDTPYVRFDIGAPEMGYSANLLESLGLDPDVRAERLAPAQFAALAEAYARERV